MSISDPFGPPPANFDGDGGGATTDSDLGLGSSDFSTPGETLGLFGDTYATSALSGVSESCLVNARPSDNRGRTAVK